MKPNTKRIVTFLCVVCLMLIDMKAANDSWYIWIITDNFVGVVFALLMFTAYPLKEYLKPLYIGWDILGIIGVIGGYAFWYTHQIGHIMGFWITVPLNIWFLGIVFFKYIEKIFITKELKIRFAKWEYVFMACMVLMLLSKSEYVWPFYFLAIFLMLWHLPFSSEDKKSVFLGLLDGILAGFIVLQGKAFLFKSYGLVRYTGAYWNSNRNGALYLLAFTSILARILIYKKRRTTLLESEDDLSKIKKLNRLIGLMIALSSVMVAFIMYTGSRTAMIGMGIISGVYYLVGERKIAHTRWRKLACQFVVFCAGIVVALPLLYYPICYLPLIRSALRTEIKNIVKGTDIPVSISNESSIQLGEALDNMVFRFLRSDINENEPDVSNDSEAEIELGNAENEVNTEIVEEDVEDSTYAFDLEQYDLDSDYYVIEYYFRDYPERGKGVIYVPKKYYRGVTSLNIRINFYATLLSNMNWIGHDSSEVFIVMNSNAPGTEERWINNEQNFIIHYLYAYGVPVGILFCLLILAELVFFITCTFKGNTESFVFAMFILVYICIGLMEPVWIPGQILLVLLFFAPLFFNHDLKREPLVNE